MSGSSKAKKHVSEQKRERDDQQMQVSRLNAQEGDLEKAIKGIKILEAQKNSDIHMDLMYGQTDTRKRDTDKTSYVVIEQKRYRKLDKFQILQNIRALMEIKNIKVGQLEKEAGCAPGYMSRLEKKDSLTTPTLEFVATAAEMLNISMELLVKGNFGEISSTDLYLVEFITKLSTWTKTQELSWKKYNPEGAGTKYQSLFFKDAEYSTTEDGYWTQLPDGDSRVYMTPVTISVDGVLRNVTELYLGYGNNQMKPLFHTASCCKALSDAAMSLRIAVTESLNTIQLDDKTRNIIDQFMSLGKE